MEHKHGVEAHRETEMTAFDHFAHASFNSVERVLVYIVAVFLIVFAGLALVNTVITVGHTVWVEHDISTGITEGIDAAFVTVILLELLHTVLSRGTLSRQLQEFLIIGITSAVRHSLEITASGNTAAHQSPRDIVIDLVINAFGVLILVAALWAVRHATRDEVETPGLLEGSE